MFEIFHDIKLKIKVCSVNMNLYLIELVPSIFIFISEKKKKGGGEGRRCEEAGYRCGGGRSRKSGEPR